MADPYQSVVGPTGRGITGDIVTFSHPDDTSAAARQGQAVAGRQDAAAVEPRRTRSCSTARASTRSRRSSSPASGPTATTPAAPSAASRSSFADRARRRPHDPPRRHRPPAVGGEARPTSVRSTSPASRSAGSLSPSQAAALVAQLDPRIVVPMPICDDDAECAEALKRFFHEMGAEADDPAEAVGDGDQPARPRRPPSCWSRAASRSDPGPGRPSRGRGPPGRA